MQIEVKLSLKLMKARGAMRFVVMAGSLLAILPIQAQERAEQFPSKPIRIVVGNAAGGGTDTIARLVGQKMSDVLGQPIVIENKPGGSNMIAAQYVAKSPPDGYTLLLGSIGMLTINPAVFAKVPYDTMRDFAPISLICSYPLVLTVSAITPVRDVQELIAYIKDNPDKANAGGTGTIYQIATKMFELRTGSKMQFIPYRSNNESIMALIRGDTLLSIVDTGPVSGPLKDGRIRALAVATAQRLPAWPDVPTMAEAGIRDMQFELWAGLLAPAGTPQDIVAKIQAAVSETVASAEIREKMQALDIIPLGSTAEEYSRRLAREIAAWPELLKATNIKIQQ
jgi:tripartite-type tricarboxylate transporter receptor subunit TctC